MSHIVYDIIVYSVIGLVCSVIYGTISKLMCPSQEWDITDIIICIVMLVLWPVMVPVAISVIASCLIEDYIKSSNFLSKLYDKLPEASELHPAEWFFAWPAKLYLLIRRKHEATGSD